MFLIVDYRISMPFLTLDGLCQISKCLALARNVQSRNLDLKGQDRIFGFSLACLFSPLTHSFSDLQLLRFNFFHSWTSKFLPTSHWSFSISITTSHDLAPMFTKICQAERFWCKSSTSAKISHWTSLLISSRFH